MALKDLLVHLDATEQTDRRLRFVAGLARQHGAHLTGLYVIGPVLPPALPIEAIGYLGAAETDSLMERWRESQATEARRAEQTFRDQVERDGVAGEFRVAEGPSAATVASYARNVDLAIVGQADPDSPGRLTSLETTSLETIEQALFLSGRPVLIVPYSGHFEAVGNTVLVGWNATREAARAVNDALPLIGPAGSVTVLTVNPPDFKADTSAVPAADIASHLARHGLKVSLASTAGGEVSIGDVLLNHASDIGADLLVVGGYGHSRFREIVLGGATRTLLQSMTVPVLMSH